MTRRVFRSVSCFGERWSVPFLVLIIHPKVSLKAYRVFDLVNQGRVHHIYVFKYHSSDGSLLGWTALGDAT